MPQQDIRAIQEMRKLAQDSKKRILIIDRVRTGAAVSKCGLDPFTNYIGKDQEEEMKMVTRIDPAAWAD